eukprot:RCo023302
MGVVVLHLLVDRVLLLLFGVVLPLRDTLRARQTDDASLKRDLLSYWTCFAIVLLADKLFSRWLLESVGIEYTILKCAFLLWLHAPRFRGARVVSSVLSGIASIPTVVRYEGRARAQVETMTRACTEVFTVLSSVVLDAFNRCAAKAIGKPAPSTATAPSKQSTKKRD